MPFLRDLLVETKDGEWGEAEEDVDSVPMRVVRGTDFDNFRIGYLDDIPVRQILRRHAERKTLRQDDIIIETAGGSKDRPTGRTVLVTSRRLGSSELPFIPASFARFLRVDRNLICPHFLFWKLQAMYADGTLKKFHTQHTGVARFQFTTFATSETLDLPDRAVQEKIAAILSNYEDLIENNTRRILILEDMTRHIFEEWFVRFRAPVNVSPSTLDSPAGSLPSGWRISKVAGLIRRHRSGTIYRKSDCQNIGSVGVIDQSSSELLGYHSNRADHLATADKPLIIFGDHTCKMQLMISEFSIGPNTVVFDAAQSVSVYYLFELIRGLTKTREYKRHWNELVEKEVVIAPDKLTDAYALLVRPMFQMQDNLRRQNRNLRAQRNLLLPKLISGEIDVGRVAHIKEAAE
jgi:type I restriction enzyme S subunit